jgi:hypothetical protein
MRRLLSVIAADAEHAPTVEIWGEQLRLGIYLADGSRGSTAYKRESGRMYKNIGGRWQPMNESSWEAPQSITQFSCSPASPDGRLLHIRLAGMNALTKHSFSCETSVVTEAGNDGP